MLGNLNYRNTRVRNSTKTLSRAWANPALVPACLWTRRVMNSALFQNVLRELCDIQVVQFICGVQHEDPELWQVMLTI